VIGNHKRYGIIRLFKLRKNTITLLQEELKTIKDTEKQEILDYLKRHLFLFSPYLYDFTNKYNMKNIKVYIDIDYDMKYILYYNKRLYFPVTWDKEMIQNYCNWLLIEQDIDSPHKYEYSEFQVQKDDVVADVGGAEGIFALSVIERAKWVYIFEYDTQWTKALKMTFSPWKEKVTIINKYISDVIDDNCTTLDDFFHHGEINFIKADIEGAEIKLLIGAKTILSIAKKLRIAICTYHNQNDANEINSHLQENGFYTEYSKGYILPRGFNACPPYLRRGLIRATKKL
jgi:hypothetical protein